MATINNTLNKPNVALVMVPKVGRLTPVSRKLYNALLHQTQQQIQKMGGVTAIVDARHLFTAPLVEMMARVSAGESDSKTSAKQYLREMRRTEVDWEAPDASTGVIWRSMGLLSEVEMEIRNGIVWVSWALPPTLLAAVADPERYTPLDLEYMAKLQSYTAIALYEICSRYKNNPTGLTSRKPPDWWVEALTSAPPSIDVSTGQLTRREWRKLKNASVLSAVNEINERTDLLIELLEFKESRAVVAVQFGVRKKPTFTPKLEISSEISLLSARLEISNAVIATLVKQYSENEVTAALLRVSARVKQTELEPIENKAAYLRKILSEDGGQNNGQLFPQTDENTDKEQDQIKKPRSILRDNEAKEAVIAAHRTEKIELVKKELFALDKTTQDAYVAQAFEELKKLGLNTPNVIKRIAQGDWKTGLLLSKVVDVYARTAHGADWLEQVVSVE
jgi:hypothetical protein